MKTPTKPLIWLELCNIFGLNLLRHSKTKAVKKKSIIMVASYGILLLALFGYMSGISYTLVMLDLAEHIPAFLLTIASLFIFFLSTLKAGSVLFRKNGYDILCSLPITQASIVVSRFLRMYVEGTIITLAVLLPGFTIYAWSEQPSLSFYLLGILGALLVPCLPIVGATLLGALITGISSRMKHKSIVSAILSIFAALGIMLVLSQSSAQLTSTDGTINQEIFKKFISSMVSGLKLLYPPATWIGDAIIEGNLLSFLIITGITLLIFAAAAALISACFAPINQNLHGTFARHNYHMEQLKETSMLSALCKKEFKRYFSSSIYVTNTIIGPIIGVLFSGALLFVDTETITAYLPASYDLNSLTPFLLAAISCMMTASCVSISMEGQNFWITKTLPLTTKNILDAKILMNLLLVLPFYLISQVLITLALKPEPLSLFWQLTIPILMLLFSCVYGITINLHFPVLNWENEVNVVKQSTSTLLGGLGSFFFVILCMTCILFTPAHYAHLAKLGICILVLGITALLYQHNNQIDLRKL